jgi:hypothetical protein
MGRGKELPARVTDFVPPFCPNPDCEWHTAQSGTYMTWQPRGCIRIERKPGWVRRFRCLSCGRWFRSSTYSDDYWKKYPGLNDRIFRLLLNGTGIRQAARVLEVAPTTIRWRLRGMARQALLAHVEQLHALRGQWTEDVAFDGLRAFAGSQYEPLDLHTPVWVTSGFVLDVNIAALRRSGTMRPEQRRRRAERDARLGWPEPRARELRARQILKRLVALVPPGRRLRLRTDEEPDYARAVAALDCGIEHTTVSSKARRDSGNPLWKVNTLHGYGRHAIRGLVRETVAFPKTAAGLWDRTWIFVLGQNNTKGIAERTVALARTTPAMRLGLARRPREWNSLCRRRRFPRRVGLPPGFSEAYEGRFRARPREKVAPYIPKFVG